ncbi:COX15/CtaA family protein [Haladaptatus halobius]|uniref:COX15/CtaA family protein n=1 Tax=Haladaptatus halobius TaxID=2884875 RepID=UPI001D0A77C9|nr:COX15/CtaA family protein [Haladaptatus halobius]
MGARFRRFAAFTTGLTFALILLGVYTAAAGAGLSCGADWPFCNGGFFWKTVPGFIEWFHRLVAMITGFFILGTTAGAWKYTDSTRIRAVATLALVVLPVQILLGGATVLIYGPVVQVAHHAAALVIFGALMATTLWLYEEPRRPEAAATESASGYPSDD